MMAATILEDDSERLEALDELALESQAPEVTEESIPEKYKGKSYADIIHMHEEAEKMIGRHSSEVGELRSVVDQYINSKTELTEEPAEKLDFFEDPEGAVGQAIEQHPDIVKAREVTKQYTRSMTEGKLTAKYPDLQKITADPAFADWVKASSIRMQLYKQADEGYDFDSADELLSNWQARQAITSQTMEAEKDSRKDAIKSASTGNIRGSGESSKKLFRRADIIKLMKTDPTRYEALSEEIMKAYSEGRVK